MKNWEIMAIPPNSLGDKSWACPARRPRNKRTPWVGPFRAILPVRGKPGACLASPNPVTQPRRGVIGRGWNPRREGGTESLLPDWSAAAAPVTCWGTFRANFGWSAAVHRANVR